MAQGWSINQATGTITFYEPPAAGAAIDVKEFAADQLNATPIWRMSAWSPVYGYPREGEFFADRLWLASTRAQPQTLWSSRIGDYSMFGRSTPVQDDDAISITLNARQLNEVVDLLPKQHLLALTIGGVWKIGGTDSDLLTPTTISARPQPSSGAGNLPSLDVGETAVYYTQKGGQVRDISFAFEADGYAGSDLTAFASHLIERETLLDWAWQAVPYSAAYAVRSDGWLLTMTYKREHQVVAWARHDTLGVIESVCCVPEDGINAVYVGVRRVVDGEVRRYVERFSDPAVADWREHIGLDSALTYDGRRRAGVLMLAGGETVDSPVTITASEAVFAANNVDDAVVIGFADARVPLRLTISEVTSGAEVIAFPSRALTDADANPAEWSFAAKTLTGLTHLEGHTVRIARDGTDAGEAVVRDGRIELQEPGVLVHVGLSFQADFESLDMTVIGGESVGTRKKIIREVGVMVDNVRVLHAGPDFAQMETRKPRNWEPMGIPPDALTGWEVFSITGAWGKSPRICIRSDDPYGATVLAIEPKVEMGG